MKPKTLLVVLILTLAVFVRLYHFQERMTFDSEQARSLVVAGEMIKDKFSLLGQEYFRVTSSGHKLFSGAIFSYSLIPLQLLFRFQPVPITIYFALLNVATGFVLFLVTKKMLGFKVAAVSMTLFLFNDMMINHSLFIWIMNYLPLVSILAIYEAYLSFKKPKIIYSFVLGLLAGLGIGLDYAVIPFALLVGVFTWWRYQKKLIAMAVYLLGLLVGNLPTAIFDLRHDFYHLRTLFEYLKEMLLVGGQKGLSYYHFFELWPVLAVAGAVLILLIYKKSRLLAGGLVALYLYLNLTSRWVSFSKPIGMPEGLTYAKISQAASAIATDQPKNFNVTVLFGFDARGYILRYPLEFIYGYKPMGVEEYPNAKNLYILAENDYNLASSGRWEVSSFPLSKIKTLKVIDNRYLVYKAIK